MKLKILLINVSLLGILVSCQIGSGNQHQETREIEGVTRVKVSGSFNLEISQYDNASLSIEGSPELAEKLEIRQSGDLLEIHLREYKSSFFQKKELLVSLSVADLRELEFDGAGNIRTTQPLALDDLRIIGKGVGNVNLELDAENVDAKLNFVGNMVLKGQVDQFRLENEGVGKINAANFRAKNLELVSSGIGNVSVHCEEELSLEVNGIGTVSYTGNPTVVHEKISGIGKVRRN